MICLVIALGASSEVRAQAYEPFDYPLASNLAAAGGGTGFSGPWRVTSSGPSNVVNGAASGVIVAGLSYTDALGQSLPVSGGAWQNSSAFTFGQAQRDTIDSYGEAGSSVWLSFLVQQSTTITGTNYAMATPGTGFAFNSAAMSAGIGRPPEAFFTAFYDNGGQGLDIGNAAAKVTLVVMRIEFSASGNDNLKVWFDPLLDQALPTADLQGAIDNYADVINGATLAFGDLRRFVFDELRVGADIGWAEEPIFEDGFEESF